MKKIIAAAAIVLGLPLLGALAYLAIGIPLQPCDAGPCILKIR